jgi:hypothetical protein
MATATFVRTSKFSSYFMRIMESHTKEDLTAKIRKIKKTVIMHDTNFFFLLVSNGGDSYQNFHKLSLAYMLGACWVQAPELVDLLTSACQSKDTPRVP